MAHRLAPLMERIHDEYDQYQVDGPGVPLRCVRVDGGTLAICGDSEQLDRRGRQAITHAGPDRRIVLLGVEDEVDVPGRCAMLEHAPLAEIEPYSVHYRGEQRYFRATYKSFLLGVCDMDDSLVLLGCVDGGLAFLVGTQEGWTYVLERDWEAHVDLDARLAGESESTEPSEQPGRGPAQPEQARSRPSTKARGKARRADDREDELRDHYMRLTDGFSAQPRALEILAIGFAQLTRAAMLPHPSFAGNYKGREHLSLVTDGLLQAIADGCGNLGGREMDMLTQLRAHAVVMPRGALSSVLRLFHLLGCPIISQPKPAKDRDSSRLWNVDVLGALDPTSLKHLALLRSIPTPIRKAERMRTSHPGETPRNADGDEPRMARARGSKSPPTPTGPAANASEQPEGATSHQPPEGTFGARTTPDAAGATVAADTTSAESTAGVGSQPLEALVRFTLGAVVMLAQSVKMLQERLMPTDRYAGDDLPASTPDRTAAPLDAEPHQGHTADGAEVEQADHDARAEEAVIALPDAVAALNSEAAAADETQHAPAASASAVSPAQANSEAPLPRGWLLDLDGWYFASCVAFAMFETDDPVLFRAVAMKVIAWVADAVGRVELASGASPVEGLACAGSLQAARRATLYPRPQIPATTRTRNSRRRPNAKKALDTSGNVMAALQAELRLQSQGRVAAQREVARVSALLEESMEVISRLEQSIREIRVAHERAAAASRTQDILAATIAGPGEESQRELTDQLTEARLALAALRKEQADDAAHVRELVEQNRVPEAITFFTVRTLGVSVEDSEHAFELLAQHRGPANPSGIATAPMSAAKISDHSIPSARKVGRNEPCPCKSGKKFKRCCWLTSP